MIKNHSATTGQFGPGQKKQALLIKTSINGSSLGHDSLAEDILETVLLAAGFLAEVKKKGVYFQTELNKLAERFPGMISSARGMGLLVGAVLTEKGVAHGSEIVNKMFDRGFLMNFAGNVALRFVPPLIVTEEEIDLLVAALAEVLDEYSA